MKNKLLVLISLVLFLVIGLSYNVDSSNVLDNSVSIKLLYDSTASNSLIIMNGDIEGISVNVNSILEDSASINLDLLDSNGNIIANLLNTYTISDYYTEHIDVGPSSYLMPGNYILKGNVIENPSGNMDTGELYLEVRAPAFGNHPPVIISSPTGTQINEHETFSYQVIATDEDGDGLSYSLTQYPSWLSISNNGFISGTSPEVSFDYQFVATVEVSDGQDFDTQTFVIDVMNIVQNDPPNIEILSPVENGIVSGEYTIRWQATDANQPSNTLDVKIEYTYDGYEWMTLVDGKNNFGEFYRWDTTSLSNANDYRIRATVIDNENSQDVDQVNFIIRNLNAPDARFIQPRNGDTLSGYYNIVWAATDFDQPRYTLDIKLEYREKTNNILINLARLFLNDWTILEDNVNNNDGVFLWNTLTVNDGDYELRLIATDDDGLTSTAYLSLITINNFVSVNHNPKIISVPITKALVNENYVYDVNAIDQDNDVLTYSLVVNPSGMNINQNTGLITWHPIVLGSYNVKVMVGDGNNGIDTQEFVVNVDTEIVVPPFQPKEAHVHKFSINNIILSNNNGRLNVYAYLRNYGTEDEKINLRATIMEDGMNKITALSLDSNDNKYGVLSFDNLKKGPYVIKVEAFNSKNYEVRYAYITIL